MDVVIGIDLGTQGVRALAVTARGEIVASSQEKLFPDAPNLPAGWAEQNALEWWRATALCLRHLTKSLSEVASPSGAHIAGIAIDSTSGTVLPIDDTGQPLHPALMYNDARSEPYVSLVRAAAQEQEKRLGYAFNASFALPKIIWFIHERSDVRARARRFVHATDFLTGRLTGDYGVTDYSDALKTGFDLLAGKWPQFIENELGVSLDHLPRVVAPGELLGAVSQVGANETGLPTGTPVYGGATDGTAAQIASGAVEPGAWNSSLGTTLVVKGITSQLLLDPQQRIYSHRHPEGWWMPGGASNTGSEWIIREFAGRNLNQLDTQAEHVLPTAIVRYPLARLGERFPFLCPRAEGFIVDHRNSQTSITRVEAVGASDAADIMLYAAGMEGTALLERLSYEMLAQIGASVGNVIHVTGGGSNSRVWLRIRASVLGRELVRPVSSETAMGAALLAATGAWYSKLSEAARMMVREDIRVPPDPTWSAAYDEKYAVFYGQLVQRGYLAP